VLTESPCPSFRRPTVGERSEIQVGSRDNVRKKNFVDMMGNLPNWGFEDDRFVGRSSRDMSTTPSASPTKSSRGRNTSKSTRERMREWNKTSAIIIQFTWLPRTKMAMINVAIFPKRRPPIFFNSKPSSITPYPMFITLSPTLTSI